MATELPEGWQCCELQHYSHDDFFQNPEDAILSWLDEGLTLDDGLCQLDGMELRAGYMTERILESEEQRDEATIGLDDPEWLEELPIGQKFCRATKYRTYRVKVEQYTAVTGRGTHHGIGIILEPAT